MFIPLTSTLRCTEPLLEILAKDRRSGAYPTKARTGDRARTGKNTFYFDDSRTVMFFTGVNVNLPTTFQRNTAPLTSDLTSDFTVIGNVRPEAIDQWIDHREQVESPGPFNEGYLYEQNESVVNSSFMTGTAFYVARDRFKSKLSDKTIVRIEKTLSRPSTLSSDRSAIHYLNPMSGGFDLVAFETVNAYQANANNSSDDYLAVIDPVLFTPYGYHYMPANGMVNNYDRGPDAAPYMQTANNYTGNGSDATLLIPRTFRTQHTASLLNQRHNANASQSIRMSDHISHPFLLEKAVVEFKVEAGPGWMNDCFQIRTVANTNPNLIDYATDAGGPMITVALLKQDKSSNPGRDLIASATFTNALDALTASYLQSSSRFFFTGSYRTVTGYTRSGVNNLVNVGAILSGAVMSGSSNFFTGTVKLVLEPAVTHHMMRYLTSGSAHGIVRAGDANDIAGYDTNPPAISLFGPAFRRPGETRCGRSLLGNHITLLTQEQITSDLKRFETDFDNQAWTPSAQIYKLYHDVIANVARSPYLLYPEDEIILCLNKHRSVVQSGSMTLGTTRTIDAVTAQHDIKIPPCQLRITLYGDLIKEDYEFHDTLNQRLETDEIWETIGEEPVLDQFDVVYGQELSSSYLDRNNIFTQAKHLVDSTVASSSDLSTLMDFARDVGNFDEQPSIQNVPWSTLAYANGALGVKDWLNRKFAWELRKSNRNLTLVSSERFWDTRLPNPVQACIKSNKDFLILNHTSFPYNNGWFHLYAGDTSLFLPSYTSGRGVGDWLMSYPYESRYNDASTIFFESLNKETWSTSTNGSTPRPLNLSYNELFFEVGVSWAGNALLFEGSKIDFVKAFYGFGDGVNRTSNQHVTPRRGELFSSPPDNTSACADIRGWRYGMLNAFPMYSTAVFRRDRFGQFRDMLEQRVDAKFYESSNDTGVKEGPIQVRFYDRDGNLTAPELTLSSNLSFEVTSSVPYCDGIPRNRDVIDYTALNISSVTF